VGTTSVRTLESIYWLGIKSLRSSLADEMDFITGQWDPYHTGTNCSVEETLGSLLKTMDRNGTDIINASTEIIIIPGYKFRMIGV